MKEAYDLSDGRLVIAAKLLRSRAAALQLSFSPWELSFVDGVLSTYRLSPQLSWRQRRALRLLVDRLTGELQHRQEFDKELQQALDQASSK